MAIFKLDVKHRARKDGMNFADQLKAILFDVAGIFPFASGTSAATASAPSPTTTAAARLVATPHRRERTLVVPTIQGGGRTVRRRDWR